VIAREEFRPFAIVASIALAAALFVLGKTFPAVEAFFRSTGYLGTFLLGSLYVYSFTSFPAAALLLIISKTQNMWMAGTIATCGAVIGDLVLFGLFRSAKAFPARRPDEERYAGWWKAIEAAVSPRWQPIALMGLVIGIFVLPLPNEFADFLLARIRRVKASTVMVLSFVGNGAGLYVITWGARFS